MTKLYSCIHSLHEQLLESTKYVFEQQIDFRSVHDGVSSTRKKTETANLVSNYLHAKYHVPLLTQIGYNGVLSLGKH